MPKLPLSVPVRGDSDIPEAWLAIEVWHEDGERILGGAFDRKEEAEAFALSMNAQAYPYRVEVVRDSAREQFRLDRLEITRPLHLTLRKHWLQRHRTILKKDLRSQVPCDVFTWRPSSRCPMKVTRLGGPPLLEKGTDLPRCSRCHKSLTCVCVLDFAGTVMEALAPQRLCVLYHCYKCGDTTEGRWLNPRNSVTPRGAHRELLESGPHIGDRWRVVDLDGSRHSGTEKSLANLRLLGGAPARILTLTATKIGGHVLWIQGQPDLKCSCGKPLQVLAQVRPTGELEFGDSGTAYILVCADTACRRSRVDVQFY